VSGLDRFQLARQFRGVFGTSVYRYSLLRRLDFARDLIAGGEALSRAAVDAGFADQAHFTRMFRRAYGLSPAQFRQLQTPMVMRHNA
jgi:AraC-like DNA-binding protein